MEGWMGRVSDEGRAGERENGGERARERKRGREPAQVKLSEDDGTKGGRERRGKGEGRSGKWASLCKSLLSSEQIREAGSHCRGVGCL